MKKLFAALLVSLLPSYVYSYDRWDENTYNDGEVVFDSGLKHRLLVGKRGVGLYQQPYGEGFIIGEYFTLKINDEPEQKFRINLLARDTYLLSDSEMMVEKIALAKKVSLTYSKCGPASCLFTYKGEKKLVDWEFEKSLFEQYPNYKEQIRK